MVQGGAGGDAPAGVKGEELLEEVEGVGRSGGEEYPEVLLGVLAEVGVVAQLLVALKAPRKETSARLLCLVAR